MRNWLYVKGEKTDIKYEKDDIYLLAWISCPSWISYYPFLKGENQLANDKLTHCWRRDINAYLVKGQMH